MFFKSNKQNYELLINEMKDIKEINKKLQSDKLELLKIITSCIPCTISTSTIELLNEEKCYILKFIINDKVFYTDILESNINHFLHVKKEDLNLNLNEPKEIFYDLVDGWSFTNISYELTDKIVYLDDEAKSYLKLKFFNKYLQLFKLNNNIINKITGNSKYKNLNKLALKASESLYKIWFSLSKNKRDKLEKVFEEISNVEEFNNEIESNIQK